MRRAVINAPLPQDVCIFCAARFQIVSSRPPLRAPRRLFSDTRSARKPPASAALGAKKQSADDDEWTSWSPPVEVQKPRSPQEKSPFRTNSTSGNQIRRKSPQTFINHDISQSASGGKFDERQRRGGVSTGTGRTDYGDAKRHLPASEKRITPKGESGNHERPWHGLRRKPAPFDRWEGNWIARSQERVRDNKKDEGQPERPKESEDSDFVGLEGLRRNGKWSSPMNNSASSLHAASLASSQRESNHSHMASGAASSFTNSALAKVNERSSTSDSSPAFDSAAAHDPSSRTVKRTQEAQNPGHVDSGNAYGGRSRRKIYQGDDQDQSLATSAPNRRVERVDSRSRRAERRQGISERLSMDDFEMEDEEWARKKAARQRKMQKAKEKQKPTPIVLPEFIRVANLTAVLRVRPAEFLRKMEELGFEGITHDHILDAETAGLVAAEYNYEPIIDHEQKEDLKAQPPVLEKSILPPRPPVVTIMGHVDHGKTTILDFLRKSSVAASEHGGITQHIGAFSVPMSGGRLVTFLDTPGHAAFLAMRQRGANVTDIVILVVAADDSVKAQTIEAMKHAQSAKVPIIVAVNKIDKDGARPDLVKQDLARYGIEIEDFGGDTQVVCVSGKTGQGMGELEDATVALADILDMRAPTDGLAEGWVLEGTTKRERGGRVATILVRRGTLHPGDVIVAGTSWARVRSLRNEAGVIVDSAGPGTPVEVDGWREQPTAGGEVLQSPDNSEQKAKAAVEIRMAASQQEQLAKDVDVVNETRQVAQEKHRIEKEKARAEKAAKFALKSQLGKGLPVTEPAEEEAELAQNEKEPAVPQRQEVFFILKADVSGSVEALSNAITAVGNSEICANILRAGVGAITEFDIEHAAAAKGHIINFNTIVEGQMSRLAEQSGVKVLDESIIYRLIDQVKALLVERLPKLVTKRVVGEAEIAQIFDINVKGRLRVPIAGCRVRNGEISKKSKVRVIRAGEVVYDGTFSSLKNVKKDISEARKGMECGMGFEGWTGFQVGDQVQTYEEKSETRTL